MCCLNEVIILGYWWLDFVIYLVWRRWIRRQCFLLHSGSVRIMKLFGNILGLIWVDAAFYLFNFRNYYRLKLIICFQMVKITIGAVQTNRIPFYYLFYLGSIVFIGSSSSDINLYVKPMNLSMHLAINLRCLRVFQHTIS